MLAAGGGVERGAVVATGGDELFEMVQRYRQVVVDVRVPGVEPVCLGIGEAGFRPAPLLGQEVAELEMQTGLARKFGDHRAQMAFAFAQGELGQLPIAVFDEALVNRFAGAGAVQ